MKMDLKEIVDESVGSIHLTPGRVLWWALVNSMRLLVLKKGRVFLD
jgi:hypothetical protein